jgi:bacteriocin biosynthesis cyclodehydratase domain-containing protein
MSRDGGLRILARGPFGRAVAEGLTTLAERNGQVARVSHMAGVSGLTRFLAGGDLGVLSSFRNTATETAGFAAAATACNLTWLPIVAQRSQVRVGPRVVPGSAPCHLCYWARSAQHRPTSGAATCDLEDTRDQSYEMAGYQPHMATLAAGLALLLRRPKAHQDMNRHDGRFFLIDTNTDAISAQQLIPVHGCPGCHSAANSVAAMRKRNEALRALATQIFLSDQINAT